MLLPSNASHDLYPNNTTRSFTIQLPKALHLKGGPWGMSLIQIMYPSTLQNVIDGENEIVFLDPLGEYSARITIPPGHYPTEDVLIATINRMIKRALGHEYLSKEASGLLTTCELPDAHEQDRVRFSTSLKQQLGFSDEKMPVKTQRRAKQVPCLDIGRAQELYIYCDVLTPTVVGHSLAPLLRAIPVQKGDYGSVICYDIHNPHYVPIGTRDFSTVGILISTSSGKPAAFEHGTCTLLVHLKPLV